MARSGATQGQKDRGPRPSAVFLNEESSRAVLGNGKQMMPMPHFAQPDNGTHTHAPGMLGPHMDPTGFRMKSANQETDLKGGLY
jgi:hypothetical protein